MAELDFGRLVIIALLRNVVERNSDRLDNFPLLRNIRNMAETDFRRLNNLYYFVTW